MLHITKFSAGDRVKIIKPTECYSTYKKAFQALGFNRPSEDHNVPRVEEGVKQFGTVFMVTEHMDYFNTQGYMYAVRLDTGEEVLMTPKGIERISEIEDKIDALQVLVDNTKDEIVKKELRRLFPSLKTSLYDKAFKFGTSYTLDLSNDSERPLFIGMGVAPDGLENKCLMFDHSRWEMKTIKQGYLDKTVIYFIKKNQ